MAAVLSRGDELSRLVSLALGQWYDCSRDNGVTQKNVNVMAIHLTEISSPFKVFFNKQLKLIWLSPLLFFLSALNEFQINQRSICNDFTKRSYTSSTYVNLALNKIIIPQSSMIYISVLSSPRQNYWWVISIQKLRSVLSVHYYSRYTSR